MVRVAAQGQNPGLPAALANNPALAQAAQQALSGGVGGPGTSSLGTGTTSYAAIQNFLIGSSLDTTGRYGLTGQPDYTGPKPAWLNIPEDAYRALQGSNNYDPWYGVLSNAGDDRVYMGPKTIKETHTTTVPAREMRAGEGAADSSTGNAEADLGYSMLFGGDGNATAGAPPRTVRNVHEIHTDGTMTVQQAVNAPFGWSSQQVADTIKKMNKSGFNVKSFDQMTQVWSSLVQRASAMYAYSEGHNKVTPMDVLSMYGKEAVKAGLIDASGNPISRLAGTTHTTTSTSVSDITQGDAWNALQNTLSSLLGRDPSTREVRDFAYRMNSLAAKDPSISKTITTYDKHGNASTHTTSHGGFDANDLAHAAYDEAQSDPNYAEHQAATTYYNAAISALGAIGQVSG